MKQNFEIYNKNIKIKFSTSSTQGYRAEMEDCYCNIYNKNGFLFGVFDGHDGDKVSHICANKLLKNIKKKIESFENEISDSLILKTIKDSCIELDDNECSKYFKTGSTAVFAII